MPVIVESVSKTRPLVVVGLIASGKTTAANYLRSTHGYQIISAGDAIRELTLSQDRSMLQKYGEELLSTNGYKYFTNLLLAKADTNTNIVIEGIRPIEVVKEIMKVMPHVKVIYVDADESVRKIRFLGSGNENIANFYKYMSLALEVNVVKIKEIADYIINNESNIEAFHHSIDNIVSSLNEQE